MIYDPSIYLLLIVGLYQRSVPFFLYGFQFDCYLKDLPIGNMVSCYSCAGGESSMDFRHYSIGYIFVDNGDTQVQSESNWETGVGGN